MKTSVIVWLGVFAVAAAWIHATEQQPGQAVRPTAPSERFRDPNAPGTGVITGRIFTGPGRPASAASVSAAGRSGSSASVETDSDGRFAFTELKPDSYRITARKAGYLTLDFGQRRAFERGVELQLADAHTLADIDITLPSGGAITGRVTDENGDPIEGVFVRALQSRFSGGTRRLQPVAGVRQRTTDDLGRYRLFDIPPGDYLVVAVVPPANRRFLPARNQIGYASTYYPGVAVPADAQPVTVGLSQTSPGADFALVPAAPARVSGKAFDSSNRPLSGRAEMALTTTDRWGGMVTARQTQVTSDGNFELTNVPPGEYVLQAIGPRPVDNRGEGEFASIPLAVNGGDIEDLVLQTSAGSRVAGRLVFDGEARRSILRDVVLVFQPLNPEQAPSNDSFLHRWRPENDGTFEMTGLNGPRRLRLLSAPPSWAIRSATADGVDIIDEVLAFGTKQASIANLEIVMTTRTATVSGKVADSSGRAVTDYTALAFSVDSRRWYAESRFVKFARPSTVGAFAMTGLPPGEYYLAAVDRMQGDELSGEWQSPEFLESLSRGAERIRLDEGDNAALTLTLTVR